jgi:hypothetical protein
VFTDQAKTSSSRVASRWLKRVGRPAGRTKAAGALRVYEYVDRHGVVLWSFTKLPFNTVRRLSVIDVRGTHFRSHISDIQSLAFHKELLDEDV